MPYLDTNGAHIHYTVEGGGDETIVFSHGLLFSGLMFGAQIDALKDRYRCITFDHRGQGRSGVIDDGYDIETLTQDATALIEELGLAPCHFVGLSMGGFVGMRVAARRPELLKSLILIETSAEAEPKENLGRYGLLNLIAQWFGLGIVMSQVMPIMFGKTFLRDRARAKQRKFWRNHIAANDRIGITRAVKGVIGRQSVLNEINTIKLPTLIVIGDEDVATAPEKSDRIHAAISDSKLVTIPNAGHSSPIEEPDRVNAAIEAFLDAHTPTTPA